MSVRAEASGKVILLGEHAVVYGVPAIAAGIAQGAAAEASLSEGPSSLTIERPADAESRPTSSPDRVTSSADPTDLGRALAALIDAPDHPKIQAVSITASSALPPGAGLGSSAALGVAVARAAILASSREPSIAEVLDRATAWERVFHGNPSGIDTMAAARGGCFRYTRAHGASPLVLRRDITLVVGNTGVVSSTRTMVEGLAKLRERKREMVDKGVEGIAALVENAALAIEAGDVTGLGKLMDLNQMLLAGLMLSTDVIETLCAIARENGALGAKLTGKGGGGCVIALAGSDDDARRIQGAWQDAGYQAFITFIRGDQDR